MDTSEQYIQMCERAEEIQPETKPLCTISEYIYIDKNGSFWHQTGIWSTDWNIIWLPRQDQLQEMVGAGLWSIIRDFHNWIFPNYITNFRDSSVGGNLEVSFTIGEFSGGPFTSMEQLWLAYVMSEKYGKVWSGEEWIEKG